MSIAGITLHSVVFTGASVPTAELNLASRLSVVYGASNTGKSFLLKAINFMLGGSTPLPEFEERKGYDRAWLALTIPEIGQITLSRALAGGPFELHSGFVQGKVAAEPARLSEKNDGKSTNNVSQFLLSHIGLSGKSVAMSAYGRKRPLSFRDLARFCIVDETAIQSEVSPALTGQRGADPVDKSVFKLLLTGQDDAAIVTLVPPKDFRARRTARLDEVAEMLAEVEATLAEQFPDPSDLSSQSDRVGESLLGAQREAEVARQSVRDVMGRKSEVVSSLTRMRQRRTAVAMNLARFRQLQDIYRSDIARLESIEEAGFLLQLGSKRNCPLCGAPPEAQMETHGLSEIEPLRESAVAEIQKIREQSTDLNGTIEQLEQEEFGLGTAVTDLDGELTAVERELLRLTPRVDEAQQRLGEILELHTNVQRGLALIERRDRLVARRAELLAMKPASKADRAKLGVAGTVGHEFAQVVRSVLEAWHFPGDHHVAFDEQTYDLKIDGKHRKDNGKGVRAITHAAFKVALLIYCRHRELPHPGFVVLDTPLLTYRDPVRSKSGPLTADEQTLKESSLKQYFFEHLASASGLGQFVVLENVDPPADLGREARLELFTGDPATGRAGLFPPSRPQAAQTASS